MYVAFSFLFLFWNETYRFQLMSGVYRSWVCCPVEFYFLMWQLCKGLQCPVGVCTLHSELCSDSVTHMTGTDMTTVVGLFVGFFVGWGEVVCVILRCLQCWEEGGWG